MSDSLSDMKKEFKDDLKYNVQDLVASIKPHGVEFKKYDTGKPRYGLIPPLAEEELAKVLTFGAEKYEPDNWRKVDDLSRYVDATLRHISAYRKGSSFDDESGLHHLAHAMCCLAFITELELEKQNAS